MRVDDVKPGIRLTGLPSGTVTVVAATEIGHALQVTIRDELGQLSDQVFFPRDLASLQPETPRSRWSFNADPGQFRLAAEALRMRHAGPLNNLHIAPRSYMCQASCARDETTTPSRAQETM